MGRFEDRMRPATYADDVECEIRLEPDPRDERQSVRSSWISERLLARIRFLALAYELPLLGRIPATGATAYPGTQMESLEDELEFIGTIVEDALLFDALKPVTEFIARIKKEARGGSLTIETR